MSTTQVFSLEADPVDDVTPVEVPVASLQSTAPAHLRECKQKLAAADRVPAVVSATCCFDDDCSLATASEADELREYVRVAAFLGAARLEVEVEDVADRDATETALEACAERARREGVELVVDGPIDLD